MLPFLYSSGIKTSLSLFNIPATFLIFLHEHKYPIIILPFQPNPSSVLLLNSFPRSPQEGHHRILVFFWVWVETSGDEREVIPRDIIISVSPDVNCEEFRGICIPKPLSFEFYHRWDRHCLPLLELDFAIPFPRLILIALNRNNVPCFPANLHCTLPTPPHDDCMTMSASSQGGVRNQEQEQH